MGALRRVALVLGVLALGLAALEVAARAWASATSRERGIGYDADMGFRPLPNVQKHNAFWGADEPARTNSRGWRDDEHPLERVPGVARVVALGDSFTFGVDVDAGERWTEHLESAGREVVNLGVNAWGPAQQLRCLEVEGVAYAPDVVVLLAFLGNDLDDCRCTRKASWPCPWFRLRGGELELVPPELDPLVRLRTSSYVGEVLAGLLDRDPRKTVRAPEWADDAVDTVPLFAALVARMGSVTESSGGRFLCALAYPSERLQEPPTLREVRARAALEAAGVALVDLHAPFAAMGEAAFVDLGSGLLGHWSPAGHELAAGEIAAALEDRGWSR